MLTAALIPICDLWVVTLVADKLESQCMVTREVCFGIED